MLKDGDRIAKTQSAVVIEKLIGQFLFDKSVRRRSQEMKAMKRIAIALAVAALAGCAISPSKVDPTSNGIAA